MSEKNKILDFLEGFSSVFQIIPVRKYIDFQRYIISDQEAFQKDLSQVSADLYESIQQNDYLVKNATYVNKQENEFVCKR